jgi:hypothetical protein
MRQTSGASDILIVGLRKGYQEEGDAIKVRS